MGGVSGQSTDCQTSERQERVMLGFGSTGEELDRAPA